MTLKHRLPHIDLREHYQFVTFRTHDSIDDFVRRVRETEPTDAKKEYIIDRYLDTSEKGRHLVGKAAEYLFDYLLSRHEKLYDLIAFCIMPNHVHLLFRQTFPLSETMKQIKGATAKTINEIVGRSGKLWETGYFDRLIRDERHFQTTYEYIKNNPVKAGIEGEVFYGIYE